MSVKLTGKSDGTICVNDMKDGQLAEVTAWLDNRLLGRVVQRRNNVLIGVGCGGESAFPLIFEERHEKYRVRLLEPGEMIEVVENDGP